MDKIKEEEYLKYLIDTYGNLVFSICFKISKQYFDAEDLTQDTFLSAYEKLSSFDGQNEKSWICKIATNKCLDHIKAASRRSIPTNDSYFITLESSSDSPESLFLEHEVKDRLYLLCNQLKPPYNDVAVDYFCKDMTIKEISEQSGKNIKTLQTQIYRAKDMLKVLWKKEDNKNEK